jgi:MFS family permease
MLERQVWRNFVAVTFSVAVLGVGLGSTYPLTALVLTARGYGPDVVGWMVAVSALGGMVGTVAAPAATARLGRRRVMLFCLALAGVSMAPLQYATDLRTWGLLRLLFGLSMAPLFVIGEAWISVLPADAVRGRVIAIYTTSFALFQVLGPLLTSALAAHPDVAFLACGGVFLLGVPGIALARDDTSVVDPRADPQAGSPAPDPSKDADASWSRIMRVAPAIVAGAAFFSVFDNVVLSFLPLFALDAGLDPHRALTAVTVALLGEALLQFGAGWLSDRYGRQRIQVGSALALCVLLPLMPMVVHLEAIWPVYLFLLGGLAGSVYTLSMVACGEYFRGLALLRASALLAMTWNLAGSSGSAATGWAMDRFGASAISAVMTLMIAAFVAAALAEGRQRARSGARQADPGMSP